MKKVFRNLVYSLLGKLIGMLALLLLDMTVAKVLNIDGYAEWVYFFSILTILFFVGWLGINGSARVKISHCVELNEKIECLRGAFFLRIGTSIAYSIIAMFVMVLIADKLGYPEKYPNLKNLFLFSGLLLFLNSFAEFYKEVLMGLERFKNVFILTTIEYAGYFLFSILFLNYNRIVYSIIMGYVVSGIIVFIMGIVLLTRNYQLWSNISWKRIYLYMEEIADYAVPMFLMGIGVVILADVDVFMLGFLSNKNEVAIYSIAKNLNSKMAHVNYSLAMGAMSAFTVIENGKEIEKKHVFDKISNINFIITIIMSIIMLCLTPLVINILYGSKYSGAGLIIRVLTSYYILYAISIYYSTFLDLRGRAWIRSKIYIVITILDIGLNYIMIPAYGAFGAAFATSISLFLYMIFIIVLTLHEWNKICKRGVRINYEQPMEKKNL